MMIKGIMDLAEAVVFNQRKKTKVCVKLNKLLLQAMQASWYFDRHDISKTIRGILSWAVLTDAIRGHIGKDAPDLQLSISLLRIRSDRLKEEAEKNESLLLDLLKLQKEKVSMEGEANAVRKNKGNQLS